MTTEASQNLGPCVVTVNMFHMFLRTKECTGNTTRHQLLMLVPVRFTKVSA